jgi:hypothetical protein
MQSNPCNAAPASHWAVMKLDPIWQSESVIQHSLNLYFSYNYWTKQNLLPTLSLLQEKNPRAIAKLLFFAPFAVLSHGLEADPILNYGNQTVLNLWEMSWTELTSTPSRQTAEPEIQAERAKLLENISASGFIQNYQGIRISSQRKRFAIANVTIWNVIDNQGHKLGQAAMFDRWNVWNI